MISNEGRYGSKGGWEGQGAVDRGTTEVGRGAVGHAVHRLDGDGRAADMKGMVRDERRFGTELYKRQAGAGSAGQANGQATGKDKRTCAGHRLSKKGREQVASRAGQEKR